MKYKNIYVMSLLFVVSLLQACAAPAINNNSLIIRNYFEEHFRSGILENPEQLSYLTLQKKYNAEAADAKLTDRSDAFAFKRLQKDKASLAQLKRFDRAHLSSADALSYDVLLNQLTMNVAGERFYYHDYVLNQMGGVHTELPNLLLNVHQIKSVLDAENYIARMGQFNVAFAQVLDSLKQRQQRGIAPPRFAVEKALDNIKQFIKPEPRQHDLFTQLQKGVNALQDADAATKVRLLAAGEQGMNASVYPSYRQLVAHLEAWLPEVKNNNGAWALPDGDAYYAHQLRENTSTDMTPEQIHQLGLSEVTRIHAEMRPLLDSLGYRGGSVAVDMNKMDKDPVSKYADNSDAAKKQVLADYTKIVDDINQRIAGSFDILPKAKLEVRAVPSYLEATSPGAYYDGPATDGSRPGIFFRNLFSLDDIQKFEMKTLTYHEAVPGHHFQVALAQELDLPMFRKFNGNNAYIEGWALYAERLASELGAYENDARGDIGRLYDELWRAKRLVVDTGIHHKRWTREQAIAYMADNLEPSLDTVIEIERYFVWPGQACGYKIGQLKILQLRDKARQALGDKFVIKDFHNVVLTNGSVPLTILEQLVDQYIAKKLAA
ncbi:MAG: hypothetical protein RL020_1442 [Pseudomonadota bacterium]|jgi:uncharacterized protein (DUF885 family)